MSEFSDYVATLSPLAYYRMNATSGFQQDSSGNANHATFQTASPTYAVPGGIIGDGDTAFTQTSTSGETSRSGMTTAPSSAITVALSVKLVGAPANIANFVNHGWASVGSFIMLEYTAATQFGVVDSTSTQRNATHSTLPRDGAFHRVVGTYDGTTVKIYVDGVKGTDAAIVNPPTLYTGTNYRMVADAPATVAMTVDELFILGSAFDQTAVDLDYEYAMGTPGSGPDHHVHHHPLRW
jgi:hypothetical protein